MRAIVVADGEEPTRAALDAAWPGWAEGVSLVVAADGGARLARLLGLRLDRWVGDGDSLGAAALDDLRAHGVPIRLLDRDKDASDTELAVLEAADAGASDITIVGALGGLRPDHALANVTLLAHPALAGRHVRILAPTARVTLLITADAVPGPARRAELPLPGPVGGLVTLLPFGPEAAGVTTSGLRYVLDAATLAPGSSRGLSNVRERAEASVSISSGRLLVIEGPPILPA